eukprot:scaffold153068_cov32-Prasinocladus_malaysianus.AAC.1
MSICNAHAPIKRFASEVANDDAKQIQLYVMSGVELATKLSWDTRATATRLVIHFAEAPGHGKSMQPDVSVWDTTKYKDVGKKLDRFPDGDPKHRELQYFLSLLKGKLQ